METRSHAQLKAAPTPGFMPARRGVLLRKCACGGSSGVTGECEECRKKRLQRKKQNSELGTRNDSVVPSIVREVLRSSGKPLDHGTRTFMEGRFGHNFSSVRVHTDAAAAESARSVNAIAYTVGSDIVFGFSRFAPNTTVGNRLLAHELTHVVQQSGHASDLQASSIIDENDATEREANLVARAVSAGNRAEIVHKPIAPSLQRHKKDIVAYSGGQSADLHVIQAGKWIYSAPAVSGHPGHGEDEPSAGPIPTGKYVIRPGIKQPTVSKDQGGTCGAGAIGSGYQEITSTDPTPCTGAHYCNVPCPTTANPAQVCYTPRDCWGPKRIKIEGSKAVVTPEGKRTRRSGFYIHGGNPKDAVSSGCVKSLDEGVFAEIRKLTGTNGKVPFCVGTACPPAVNAAIQDTVLEIFDDFVEAFSFE
jgi:hypothetical protein